MNLKQVQRLNRKLKRYFQKEDRPFFAEVIEREDYIELVFQRDYFPFIPRLSGATNIEVLTSLYEAIRDCSEWEQLNNRLKLSECTISLLVYDSIDRKLYDYSSLEELYYEQ